MLTDLAATDDRADGNADLAGSAQRLFLAHDALLNVLQVLLGSIEQLAPLTPAFLSESVVLANDEALTWEQLRAFDLSEISLVEQRQLQGAVFGGELLYRRGSQRSDPVEPSRLEVISDARIGDHPAVADHHDTLEAEALLELRNLVANCRWIAGVA